MPKPAASILLRVVRLQGLVLKGGHSPQLLGREAGMDNSFCQFLWCKSTAVCSQRQAMVQALGTTTGTQETLNIKDHSL